MTTKEFFEKVSKDNALAEKIKVCKTPDDAYAVAKEAGITDSMEDFVKTAEELSAKYKEMSPEEIDSVTAAGNTITTLTTTTTVTIGASAAAV